jgi:hypothetical protein
MVQNNKIYIPSINAIDWSNDVIIDWESPMIPLTSTQAASTEELDTIFNDQTFIPEPEQLDEDDFQTASEGGDIPYEDDIIQQNNTDQNVQPNNPVGNTLTKSRPIRTGKY